MPSISPCSMRRSVASSTSRARGIAKRDQALLDAVERGGSGMDRHDRPPDDGETLADGLIEGERASGDVLTDAADDDGVCLSACACALAGAPCRWAGSIRYCRRPSRTGWVATSRPSSRMRIDVRQLMHLDDAPGAIGNAVVVAADRDEAVMADAPFELRAARRRAWRAGAAARAARPRRPPRRSAASCRAAGRWRPLRASRRAAR